MSSYQPVGWANDETHPLSQANMKTLDQGILDTAQPLDVAEVASGTALSLTLTIPSGFDNVKIVGHSRTDRDADYDPINVRLNDVSVGGSYRSSYTTVNGSDAPITSAESFAQIPMGNTVGASVTGGNRGQLELALVGVLVGRCGYIGSSVAVGGTTVSAWRRRDLKGQVTFDGPITTVQVFPTNGAFTADTRFELWRG